MILLVTKAHPTIARHQHPSIGRLVQPRHYSSVEATAVAGIPWAADNDAYNSFDAAAFRRMLDRLYGLPGCVFVAAPDVVGDATATAVLFEQWWWTIARLWLPVALVAQDGLTPERVPWDEIACLFIGGTTAWKLGSEAEQLVTAAHERDKWVHMGRVNSHRRIRYARAIGCDSVDGTNWARFSDRYLRAGLTSVAAPAHSRIDVS